MATALSKAQIETYWIRNGGAKAKAPLMAAIALAESGGNPSRINSEGPEHAEGLWQIKGQIVKGNPLDPNVSAQNAVAKLSSQGLGAWTTYTSGAYKQYLGATGTGIESKAPPGEPEGGVGGVIKDEIEAIKANKNLNPKEKEEQIKLAEMVESKQKESGIPNPLESIEAFLGKIAKLWEEPQRSAKFVGGVALLYMGVHALTQGTAAGGAVEAPKKALKAVAGAGVGVASGGSSKAVKLGKKKVKAKATAKKKYAREETEAYKRNATKDKQTRKPAP